MRTISAVLAAAAMLMGGIVPSAVDAKPRQTAPGVYVDPSTPTGKEYALQLQQARGTGSSRPSAQSGNDPSARFGSGISSTPRTSSAPGAVGSPGRRPNRPASDPGAVTGRVVPAASGSASAVSRSSGSGGTLALIGGAAAILILGGLGGVLLRRRKLWPATSDRRS
jgi:hypothetical protein